MQTRARDKMHAHADQNDDDVCRQMSNTIIGKQRNQWMTARTETDANTLIAQLVEKSGVNEEDIRTRMKEKIDKFSGLLTEQGALVLLSRELNVRLPVFEKVNEKLTLNQLKMGMNNVDVVARVKYADRMKTYAKNGKEGKYLAVRLSDETGEALFTFWNEQADDAVQKNIRVGSTVTLSNARVGVFNQMTQLSLGYNGIYTIENDAEMNSSAEINSSATATQSVSTTQPIGKFSELNEGAWIETNSHVLDVLPGKGYYVRCLACNGKLQKRETTCPICMTEGKIDARLLVSLLLDDGSKPLRGVAFENEVAALYGKTKEELLSMFETDKENVDKTLRGTLVRIQGTAKMGMDKISLEIAINRVIRIPFANA